MSHNFSNSTIILTAIFLVLAVSGEGSAEPVICMETVKFIESSNNPLAHNKRTDARGHYQITPICLKDYNMNGPGRDVPLTMADMFNPILNKAVAEWYINEQLTKYLKYYKIPLTAENYLIAYHDGIGNLIKYRKGIRKLGPEMKEYLKKYEKFKKTL